MRRPTKRATMRFGIAPAPNVEKPTILIIPNARIAAIIILSIGTEDITKGLGKWRIIPKRNVNIAVLHILSDGYCRNCWKRLPDAVYPKEELLNGVKKADWHFFIDKNASRYVDIYAENENKKFFLSWNWAAFFFGVNWMCYRKMYKNAVFLRFCILLLRYS